MHRGSETVVRLMPGRLYKPVKLLYTGTGKNYSDTAQFQVAERAGKFWRDTPPEPRGVNYAVLP